MKVDEFLLLDFPLWSHGPCSLLGDCLRKCSIWRFHLFPHVRWKFGSYNVMMRLIAVCVSAACRPLHLEPRFFCGDLTKNVIFSSRAISVREMAALWVTFDICITRCGQNVKCRIYFVKGNEVMHVALGSLHRITWKACVFLLELAELPSYLLHTHLPVDVHHPFGVCCLTSCGRGWPAAPQWPTSQTPAIHQSPPIQSDNSVSNRLRKTITVWRCSAPPPPCPWPRRRSGPPKKAM